MIDTPRRSIPRATFSLSGLALVLAGCAGEAPPPPSIVLVVVDTLRADRLPMYGGPPDAAPFLAELAERSLVFENAWSPSSWTLPATVSVLTSLHPFQHGVEDLVGLELPAGSEPVPVARIPDEVATLAEELRAAGYRTFGVVSNVLLGSEVGLERGFDRFVRLDDEDADAVNARVEAWRAEILAGGGEGAPFFLYLHYFDPHDPLHARAPWFERARAALWPAEPQPLRRPRDLDWMRTRLEPGPDATDPSEDLAGKPSAELTPAEVRAVVDWMRAAYDSEIGFVDARIRAVHALLGLERAVVAVLSDHGEEFLEHGDLTHGQNLHAETTRVPLILHVPGPDAPRGRVTAHVGTLDVAPTLLRLAGVAPRAQHAGRDLLALPGRSSDAPVLGRLSAKSGQDALAHDLRSIVRAGHRLIASGDGRLALYDLARDPLELHDVAAEHPELAAELLRALEELERAAPPFPHLRRIPTTPPSPALLEHLDGIGYTGGDDE
jgi:arylsulfatase A-like enzyme